MAEGNRTLILWVETRSSTIELQPHAPSVPRAFRLSFGHLRVACGGTGNAESCVCLIRAFATPDPEGGLEPPTSSSRGKRSTIELLGIVRGGSRTQLRDPRPSSTTSSSRRLAGAPHRRASRRLVRADGSRNRCSVLRERCASPG